MYQSLETEPAVSNPFIESDDAVFEYCLSLAEDRLIGDAEGFLGPDSISWKIFREPCILLGGFRAVMMQMTHPAVAQGVEQSSSFRYDLIGRAKRTIQAMNSLVFGSRETALKAATAMHTIHHRVHGYVPETSSSSLAGSFFRANDQNLKNWVGLTTLESVIVLFESLVRPLSEAERAQFAYESQTIAMLCGLTDQYYKSSLDEFTLVRDEMFAGTELAMSDVAQGIVLDLFEVVPTDIDERLTLGFLPPAARDLYGIKWTEKQEEDFQTIVRKLSFVNRTLPPAIRYIPAYRMAKLRVAKAKLIGSAEPQQKSAWGRPRGSDTNYYLNKFGFVANDRQD